jgi:hypothetical protein
MYRTQQKNLMFERQITDIKMYIIKMKFILIYMPKKVVFKAQKIELN